MSLFTVFFRAPRLQVFRMKGTRMNIRWDAEDYKNSFSFVPAYGEDVMGLLTVPRGSRVVDLGCGTGALTEKLKERGFRVTGVDSSDEMLEIARSGHPDLSFVKGDAAEFQLEAPVDAVFSNAVMHWIDADRQMDALSNISSNIKTGGEFVFEFGGYGCAETVHKTLEEIFAEHGRKYLRMFYFPTVGEYAPLVEKCGMRVELAMLFDRPTPQAEGHTAKDWIRMFDKKPFEGIPREEAENILEEAEQRLKEPLFVDGTWFIDYVRIRMRARKV